MARYAALLRGVNVGGNKVAMSDLCELVAALGHTDVVTYIQSGNVVFTSPKRDTRELAAELEQAIAEKLTVRTRVLVLSRADLARAMRDNPYPDETNPKALHAVFLFDDPDAAMTTRVKDAQVQAAAKGSRDEAQVVGHTLYLHVPDGLGRSELAAQLGKGGAAAPMRAGTARNWATVGKLLELCEEPA